MRNVCLNIQSISTEVFQAMFISTGLSISLMLVLRIACNAVGHSGIPSRSVSQIPGNQNYISYSGVISGTLLLACKPGCFTDEKTGYPIGLSGIAGRLRNWLYLNNCPEHSNSETHTYNYLLAVRQAEPWILNHLSARGP